MAILRLASPIRGFFLRGRKFFLKLFASFLDSPSILVADNTQLFFGILMRSRSQQRDLRCFLAHRRQQRHRTSFAPQFCPHAHAPKWQCTTRRNLDATAPLDFLGGRKLVRTRLRETGLPLPDYIHL
jgi:hypothetical protein